MAMLQANRDMSVSEIFYDLLLSSQLAMTDVLIIYSLSLLAHLTDRPLPANITSPYDSSLASSLLFLFHVKISSGKLLLPAHIPVLIISNKTVLFIDPGVWYFPWRAGFGQLYLRSVPQLLSQHLSAPQLCVMSEFIDLCYICQEAVCFLFSLLLLGDFQEKYFSFRGRNTNQNFCRFFILFYVVYLAYSFYLLLISYSKNTNNPTTSTPISMCPFSFYFCYQ